MTEHYDFMGQPLAVGDYIVTQDSHYIQLRCWKITSFTPKNVRLALVMPGSTKTSLRTAEAMCKIDPELVTMYIMKNST